MSNQNTTRPPIRIRGHDGPIYHDDWPSRVEALRRIPSFQQTVISLGSSLYDLTERSGMSVDLYSGDCETTPGVANCTAACSDPFFLFTPSNLRACVPIAVAALAVQNGTFAVNTTHPETMDAIASWRVPDLQTFNATGMLANVARCIAEPCGDPRSRYCEQGTPYIHTIADLRNLTDSMRSYCFGLNDEVNADIAGPGVSTSCQAGRQGLTTCPPRANPFPRSPSHTLSRRASPSCSSYPWQLRNWLAVENPASGVGSNWGDRDSTMPSSPRSLSSKRPSPISSCRFRSSRLSTSTPKAPPASPPTRPSPTQ